MATIQAEGVGYSNQDLSKTFNFTFPSGTKRGDCVKKIGMTISSYLDGIFTDMGFKRADNHGNHSNLEINFSAWTDYEHKSRIVNFINAYRLNEDESNFLILNIKISSSNPNSDYSSSDNKINENNIETEADSFCFQVQIFYSRSIPIDGYISIIKNQDYGRNAWMDWQIIPTSLLLDTSFYANGQEFILVNFSSNSYQCFLEFRRIKNNYYDFITLNQNKNANPIIGIIQSGDKKKMCYCYGNYISTDNGSNNYHTPSTINFSNILVVDNEIYTYGSADVLSGYSFRDLDNKMPLIPVFESEYNISNSYNFDKPIMGIMQTSDDFIGTREVIYQLNNKIYRNLGNRYILEEGEVPQQ